MLRVHSGAERTLSLVSGREMAPPSDCVNMFVYVPPSPDAPPLLFADNAPPAVGGCLERPCALATLARLQLGAHARALLRANNDSCGLSIAFLLPVRALATPPRQAHRWTVSLLAPHNAKWRFLSWYPSLS